MFSGADAAVVAPLAFRLHDGRAFTFLPSNHGFAVEAGSDLSFAPPHTFELVPPGQGHNDVLFTRDAGRVQHVDRLR